MSDEKLDITNELEVEEKIMEGVEEELQNFLEEEKELTDEEKKEIYIKQLKESKIKFRNTVHNGNVTITKFGADYRKKRQRKNKLAKASRKANRK
jgi:hypothetical protein